MRYIALFLVIAVHVLYSDRAFCGPRLLDVLNEAITLIGREDPRLFFELEQSRQEFSQIAETLALSYAGSAALRQREAPYEWNILKETLYANSLAIYALPRALYIGSVARSAINFLSERVIILDHQLWRGLDSSGKQLVVLTELARFAGIEAEDDRYRFAANIIKFLNHDSKTDQGLTFDMVLGRDGEPLEYDKGKVLFTFTKPGEDRAELFIMNSRAGLLHARVCQAPGPETVNPLKFDGGLERFNEGIESTPGLVELCLVLMKSQPLPSQVTFSRHHLHMTSCWPVLR